MKRLIGATIAALVLSGAVVGAEQRGKQNKNKNKKDVQHASAREEDRGGVSVHFSTGDVRVIREHYAPKYRSLPPGLQKKVARGGQLPPGWQKKMQPMPVELERTLPRLAVGYHRGVIDGHAVIYNSKGLIIDVAVLF